MFAKHLLTAGAVVGLLMTGAMTTTAFAQASGSQTAAPAKPMDKSMSMNKSMPMKKHSAMHKASAKEGHKMDNIADKLNACQLMPQAQRQGCMSDATKM